MALGALALVLVALGYLVLPGFTPPLRGPNPIASLETITLGGWPQSVLIRGRDQSNPMLLFLHGGPGMPAMYLHHRFGHLLEEAFVVVHWDQRGAGRSFSQDVPQESMSVEQILADGHELMELLLNRFAHTKLFLVGHSWGSYLGMNLAQRHPEMIHAYVGVGQVTDPEREAELTEEYIRRRAHETHNLDALRELDAHGPAVHEKWLFRFEGELRGSKSILPLLLTGLMSPEYSLRDGLNIARGSSYSSAVMQHNVLDGPLMSEILVLEVPVYFFQGRNDYVTPSELAAEYLKEIEAPQKEFVWFEKSAHFPFFEEPKRFGSELLRVRREVLSSYGMTGA